MPCTGLLESEMVSTWHVWKTLDLLLSFTSIEGRIKKF